MLPHKARGKMRLDVICRTDTSTCRMGITSGTREGAVSLITNRCSETEQPVLRY